MMLAISLCYAVALFHRTAFQAIDGTLQSELGLSPEVTADIAAVFFWTYLAVLIPVGLLTDRQGARRVAIGSSLLSAAGTLLFCASDGVAGLLVGRALVAAGSVGAFIAMMRYIALAWPEAKAKFSGRALFIGNLGAMASGAPLAWLLEAADWRWVWFGTALASLVLCCLVALLSREAPPPLVRRAGMREALGEVAFLFRSRWVRVGVVLLAGLAGTFYAFGNLVGPRWLSRLGYGPVEAGWGVTLLVFGYALGAAFWGWVGDMEHARTRALLLACIGALLCWLCFPALAAAVPSSVLGLFVVAGFFCGAFSLVYPLIVERHPPQYAGGVVGCVNCGIPLGAALLQTLAGRLSPDAQSWLLVAAAAVAVGAALLLVKDRVRRPAAVSPATGA